MKFISSASTCHLSQPHKFSRYNPVDCGQTPQITQSLLKKKKKRVLQNMYNFRALSTFYLPPRLPSPLPTTLPRPSSRSLDQNPPSKKQFTINPSNHTHHLPSFPRNQKYFFLKFQSFLSFFSPKPFNPPTFFLLLQKSIPISLALTPSYPPLPSKPTHNPLNYPPPCTQPKKNPKNYPSFPLLFTPKPPPPSSKKKIMQIPLPPSIKL